MLPSVWRRWLNGFKHASPTSLRPGRRPVLRLEALEDRTVPAFMITNGANFAVSVDADEAVAIGANGPGFVTVSINNGAPMVQPTLAGTVTSLTVTATGTFDNTIDLSLVDPAF